MSMAELLGMLEQNEIQPEDNQAVANAWQGEVQTCSLQGNPGGCGLMEQLFAALPPPDQNINPPEQNISPPEVSLEQSFAGPSNDGFEIA